MSMINKSFFLARYFMLFHGSYTALLTPFKDNKVDFDAYRKLIDFQIENGTNGLVPVGTTGESPTLSHDEHKKIIEETIRITDKRIPVIAGTGSNNTLEAIEYTDHAEKSGADAALIVTPYYNKPTQSGLYEHFKIIADKTNIPIIIYNLCIIARSRIHRIYGCIWLFNIYFIILKIKQHKMQ